MYAFDGTEYPHNPGTGIAGIVFILKSANYVVQMLINRDRICTRRFVINTAEWGNWVTYVQNSDLLSSLEESILTYARSSNCKYGFSSGIFPGENYAYTEELPNKEIRHGTWEINKRTNNTIIVKVFSPFKSTMWINSYVNTYGWRGWEQMATTSDIQSGIVDIPANTTSVTIQFKQSFTKDPIVVVTGKFVHKTNIFCTIASVGKNSFSIYPIDSSTNNAPTENSRFNWIAIDI